MLLLFVVNNYVMREGGFEPPQALSYVGLNDVRLTTPAFPLLEARKNRVIKIANKLKNYRKEA